MLFYCIDDNKEDAKDRVWFVADFAVTKNNEVGAVKLVCPLELVLQHFLVAKSKWETWAILKLPPKKLTRRLTATKKYKQQQNNSQLRICMYAGVPWDASVAFVVPMLNDGDDDNDDYDESTDTVNDDMDSGEDANNVA